MNKQILTCLYSPEAYPTYDNYPAIEVSKSAEIPIDFMGLMGVPITALDIPGLLSAFDLIGMSSCNEQYTPGLLGGRLKLHGKEVYRRLLIRRKIMTLSRVWMEQHSITEADLPKEEQK